MHSDPTAVLWIQMAGVVALAILGRKLARSWGQASVLGELLLGVIIGTGVILGGWTTTEIVHNLTPFANFGVLMLLLMAGLEFNVAETLRVGPRALVVALVGVVVPMAMGLVLSWSMLEPSWSLHFFIAATLAATSIGITARVLKDLNHLNTKEARIILAAAAIDDVLGLVILSAASRSVQTGDLAFGSLLLILVTAFTFVVLALWQGEKFARGMAHLFHWLEPMQARLLTPLVLCFVLSWLAHVVGLNAIVGAFVAGVILRDEFFPRGNGASIHDRLAPLESLFAPVFFVLIGLQVDIPALFTSSALGLGLLLTVAAIVGKLSCGWVAGNGVQRWTIGIGMIPRGEVGLIFAGIGRTLGVFSNEVFSAIVMMVLLTTLVTPPLLRWAVKKS